VGQFNPISRDPSRVCSSSSRLARFAHSPVNNLRQDARSPAHISWAISYRHSNRKGEGAQNVNARRVQNIYLAACGDRAHILKRQSNQCEPGGGSSEEKALDRRGAVSGEPAGVFVSITFSGVKLELERKLTGSNFAPTWRRN